MSKGGDKLQGEALAAFRGNLKNLRDIHKVSGRRLGAELRRRGAEISDKTVSNIQEGRHPPVLDNLTAIAEYFGVPLWVMFVPGLPKEMLERERLNRLVKLVSDYLACSDEQRRFAENMAAGYAGLTKKP